LRIGFVSPDFGLHPVAFVVVRALEGLARRECVVVCYSDRATSDELTLRFQRAAHLWRDVWALTDQQLAEQVRTDQIDVLFDLAGHTASNRLLTFARKPAPIQITWAGYEGTTGLEAMDYLLADRWEIPAGAEPFYRERVLRLPHGFVCYDPPADAPQVGPLPALECGHVTFGSFNNPAKLSPPILAAWSAVLRRVPGSRLVLKYKGLDEPLRADRLRAIFAQHATDPQRLELLGSSPRAEWLSEFRRIDLALDSYPFSGGATTCETLWMGVPVITCPGQTFASRHTLSHLSNVGLAETVAGDLHAYVDRAATLAQDLPRLAEIRAGLRQQVAHSPLCDGARFADDLLAVLRDVWHAWCQR
jgi:predicted O-linked N-acetylglucosamine transferase (SPINDLY family)